MKGRKWAVWLVLAAMFLTLAVPVGHAAGAAGGISIVLDGKTIESDVAPYIIPVANVTMVPLRIISEELGATVGWSQKEQQVTIRGGADKLIVMKRGERFALVNDNRIDLEASVDMKSGRTMVPLRFVSETLGLNVKWSQKEQLITLTTGGSEHPSQPSSGTGGDPEPGGQPSDGNPGNRPEGNAPSDGNTSGKGLRGVWVSTVYNLDWPSQGSYGKSLKQMEEFRQLLDDVQSIGMNAVFVQVRPASDAFYPSLLVPWSRFLTGVQGLAPDYDPLSFMIEETHKRGMEFHAWFNPFRASVDAKTETLTNNHVVKQQPDWIVNAGGKLYINPGIPQARQHIINTIMEVVNGYNIDGVHLDDYFYPTNVDFADNQTFQAYNPNSIASKADCAAAILMRLCAIWELPFMLRSQK